jgi:DNA polymerase IV (archaeal DinB-like DNA polymerase)
LTRVVGHLDLDYFYAQVEEVENPSLKALPLVVCVYSGRTADSGVVSTANYKARELGVRSGIPIVIAKRRLEGKNASFIPMDHEKYEAYSERVMEIVRTRVDVMEQTGIDETFFDISKRSNGDYDTAVGIAAQMKRNIMQREKLTCSIGIAPNKVVAKLASDFRKPDGLTLVLPTDLSQFMRDMPVEKLYGVGPKSARILKEAGVATIGDLAGKDQSFLDHLLGQKFAVYLHNAANGIDEEPVVSSAAAKQLSRLITLKRDSRDLDEITGQLSPAIEDLHIRVLEKGLFFRSVSIIGILPDLTAKTRSRTLEAPTNDALSLRKTATELLSTLLSETRDLRRVGIRVSDFTEATTQSSLAEFLG